MNHMGKILSAALLICALLVAMLPTAALAATSTSWADADGDSFKVTTTKANATVTVQVRKVKSFLGLYPQDAITVVFDPSGSAKTVKAKTGWYAIKPSNGLKSYTLTFPKAGTYTVDVDLGSGMDRFMSNGGDVEWRVSKCKNASVK